MSMFALPHEIVPVVNKHYVYVLLSTRDQRFYVGLTSDVVGRLQQHNDGKVPSTKARGPFALIYWEGCLNRSDAAQREKYLKSDWGKRYLKTRLKNYLTGLTATSPSPR
jgi:putative endonuclease